MAGTYTNTLTFSGTSASLSVGRSGYGIPYGSNLYAQAANKLVNYGTSLTLPSLFTVTDNNGYGLNLTGTMTIPSGGTISVANYTSGYQLNAAGMAPTSRRPA